MRDLKAPVVRGTVTRRDSDVIVVGAGAGGLSAAIASAARGLRVVVVEAHDEAGGKIGRTVSDGVEMDTGPSVIALSDVLEQVFARGRRRLRDELSRRPLDLATRYRFPDGCAFDTFSDGEKTLREVERVLGQEASDELSAYPGGGVPLCLASGLFAADALLADLTPTRSAA